MGRKEIRSFEDLKVWQKSRDLRIKVSDFTKCLPSEEKYRLKDQLLRASRSVTANIAEGYGRFHYQEYIQYCRQARGSLYEVLDHLICANDENYINDKKLSRFRNDITDCIRLLNGFISYLRNTKKNNSVRESDIIYQVDTNNH